MIGLHLWQQTPVLTTGWTLHSTLWVARSAFFLSALWVSLTVCKSERKGTKRKSALRARQSLAWKNILGSVRSHMRKSDELPYPHRRAEDSSNGMVKQGQG